MTDRIIKQLLILLLFSSLGAGAEPLAPDLIDWDSSPEKVLQTLKARSIEAELTDFHKTGVPYIKAQLQTLGNTWDTTIYFDEENHPNQILLQIDEISRSGLTRVQKLAVGDYGDSYEVREAEGEGRRDTFFTWNEPTRKIVLNSATRKTGSNSVWLQVEPK